MLKNIKIEGYKSIKSMDLTLSAINILIGSNGVGKSNFVSFFKLVNHIYEQRLQQFSLKHGADNLLYFGRKQTNSVSGYLDFGNNAYKFELVPNLLGGVNIEKEESVTPNTKTFRKSYFDSNLMESRIKGSDRERDKFLRQHLESYKIYHFHDTSENAPLRTRSPINDNRILRENGSNLPAYLYLLKLKYPKSFKRIEAIVQSVVPDFERFELEPMALDENVIELNWSEKNYSEHYFNATHLSDGSLRFIALVTLLEQPILPKVILIDEPELGLHPVAIEKLAGLIKSVAARDCQVIVSTQSVNLLNHFDAEDVITVDRVGGQSVFARLDSKALNQWLNDYSLGELWTKSLIKGQP
jgi:predicted ATPase